MSKDLWIIEHETIGDEYAAGDIERDEAEARLKTLGFDPHEIKEQLDELDEDRTSGLVRNAENPLVNILLFSFAVYMALTLPGMWG